MYSCTPAPLSSHISWRETARVLQGEKSHEPDWRRWDLGVIAYQVYLVNSEALAVPVPSTTAGWRADRAGEIYTIHRQSNNVIQTDTSRNERRQQWRNADVVVRCHRPSETALHIALGTRVFVLALNYARRHTGRPTCACLLPASAAPQQQQQQQ